ncbi:MAG: hypothetical protein VKK32_07795 [Candidatus Melainabacteria bacterium]|nr:hypothetical protein [Candidatus Melainabacteria bacterium]
MSKSFYLRDFIYNNGAVNLADFIIQKQDENPSEDWVKSINVNVNNTEITLTLLTSEISEKRLFIFLFLKILDEYKIVYETANERTYWDLQSKKFINRPKLDIKGKASGNDVLSGTYDKVVIDIDSDQADLVYEKLVAFEKDSSSTDYKVKDLFTTAGVLKKKKDLIVYTSVEKAKLNYMQYFLGISRSKEYLNEQQTQSFILEKLLESEDYSIDLDSKIHLFEDGARTYKDLLSTKLNELDLWDALVYFCGSRFGFFYSGLDPRYYVYPNALNFKLLFGFKGYLEIPLKDYEFTDEKKAKKINTRTNIAYRECFANDRFNVLGDYYYITRSPKEFLFKSLLWLTIQFRNLNKKITNNRELSSSEEFKSKLFSFSFVSFATNGTQKTAFETYTRLDLMIKMLDSLRETAAIENNEDDKNLLGVLLDVQRLVASVSENNPQLLELFYNNLLNFISLREIYFNVFYLQFSKAKQAQYINSKYFAKLECFYIGETTKGDGFDMISKQIHDLCEHYGNGLGSFCALGDSKSLIFKLRNVKNESHMINFFTELQFTLLKASDDGKDGVSSLASVKEDGKKLWQRIAEVSEDWEFIRDYIAIYAINKFMEVDYAKNKQKESK